MSAKDRSPYLFISGPVKMQGVTFLFLCYYFFIQKIHHGTYINKFHFLCMICIFIQLSFSLMIFFFQVFMSWTWFGRYERDKCPGLVNANQSDKSFDSRHKFIDTQTSIQIIVSLIYQDMFGIIWFDKRIKKI